jgi:hypothetical protein
MYYLLVAAAVALTGPGNAPELTRIEVNESSFERLSEEDVRRVRYNVRKWENDMNAETVVFLRKFETLEACKSVRASIRIAMRDAGKSDALRSNCYQETPADQRLAND